MPNSGLMLLPGQSENWYRNLYVDLAARNRLPAIYPDRSFVAAGGLMSYGIDRAEMFRQGASYVDRILGGEWPANLPIQAPVKYETVLNLKTAKALGLRAPSILLAAADEVIRMTVLLRQLWVFVLRSNAGPHLGTRACLPWHARSGHAVQHPQRAADQAPQSSLLSRTSRQTLAPDRRCVAHPSSTPGVIPTSICAAMAMTWPYAERIETKQIL